MSVDILNVTFSCLDPRGLARFWADATGHALSEEADPLNPFWVVAPADGTGPRLVFVAVSPNGAVRNRLHLDVVPRVDDQASEVARLCRLGARVVDDRSEMEPGGWVVMADPEGNEFCVE